MRWNIGVSMQYHYQNGVVYINQHAYIFRLFGANIPTRASIFLGKFSATEKIISEDTFDMSVLITHPLFGKIFKYTGRFKLDSKL